MGGCRGSWGLGGRQALSSAPEPAAEQTLPESARFPGRGGGAAGAGGGGAERDRGVPAAA